MNPEEQQRNIDQVCASIARVCKMTPERVWRAVVGMQRDGLRWPEVIGVFAEVARAHGNVLVVQHDLLQTTGRAAVDGVLPKGGNPS